MGELRRDARACREKASSELIRRSLGIETPEERTKRLEREQERASVRRRQEQKGILLGLEDGDV